MFFDIFYFVTLMFLSDLLVKLIFYHKVSGIHKVTKISADILIC